MIQLNTNGVITHSEPTIAHRLPQGTQQKLNTGKAHHAINIEMQRSRVEDDMSDYVQHRIHRKAERMSKRNSK